MKKILLILLSDLSYEDMMDDRKLTDIYNVSVVGDDLIEAK